MQTPRDTPRGGLWITYQNRTESTRPSGSTTKDRLTRYSCLSCLVDVRSELSCLQNDRM